jgi:hypothetical protein
MEKLPGGITQYGDYDNTGEPVDLRYTGQTTTINDDGTTTVDPNGRLAVVIYPIMTSPDVSLASGLPDGAAFTAPADDAPGDAIPYDRAYSYDNAAWRRVGVR